MERLTEMYGGMMVPRKACTFDREGGADDCKECTEICEDEGGVCRTCILQECLTRLGEYEDTGLTPERIMELKEAVQRLDKIFGDEITVDQVIDFFVDFYIAQGDDERVEAAELLTNKEVERYKRLKERDTAKAPEEIQDAFGDGRLICPHCRNSVINYFNRSRPPQFCMICGQRLKFKEDAQ